MAKTKKQNTLTESQVLSKVSFVIGFIKEQLVKDLNEARVRGQINLQSEHLSQVTNLANSSIEASFIKSSSEISNLFK